ncbi:hypothetical protein BWK59_11715 [Flavobacterium davisii]|uniref:Uncharacterized protein n=1 Tax=Flavobacterium davisii TaxID=2906077 RepID=A0A246GGF2_9FLAO|nr:hypothetical protein [Flavobacterium davisii]OWP83208.1 hypothetical protein BWK59_11715 [Flavobacterium davisii]
MKLRFLATFILFLAGLINYSDKFIYFFEIQTTDIFGFKSSADFAYALSVTISPILISFASFFKPFKIGYLFPIYVYSCDLIFWLFGANKTDYGNSYWYGFFFVLLLVSIILIFKNKIKEIESSKLKNKAIEELLELSFETISIKKR